jgi:acyl-CoA dehydrogenase
MFSEIELAKSVVMEALDAVERKDEALPLLSSLAKAKVSDTFHTVSSEAIQMYGGIGMTDDEEIGFFLKRARVAEQTFGDAKYHRSRYARLSGF